MMNLLKKTNSSYALGILLFLFFISENCLAIPSDSGSCRIGRDFVHDLKCAWSDLCFVGEDFIKPGASDAVLLGGSIAAVSASILWDGDLRQQSFRWRSTRADDFFAVTNYGGEILYLGGFAGGLYSIGLLTDVPELRRTGRLLLEAYLVGGMAVTVTKFIVGRARPYNDLGNGDIRWFQSQDDFQSLPSGHTAVAFATATVLSGVIDRWWAYIPLYAGASAVGITRIYKDKHWLSDVILGATIGTYSGLSVLSSDKRTSSSTKGDKTKLDIYPSPGGLGLSLKF